MWRKIVNRIIVTLAMLAVVSGCAGNHAKFLLAPPLPEHIYRQPFRNYYANGEIGVFVFGSPLYAPAVGDTAADTISQYLLEQKVFRRITPLYQYGIIPLDRQMAIAREHGVDLMLVGNVLYYMDGSLSQVARVDMEVRVFEVATGSLVWNVAATEVGRPKAESDYFITQTSGKPAAATMGLMMKNAEKIVRLFQLESPAYQHLSEDMKLVDSGYQYMAKGDYQKARPHFENAIGMARENAHALYNLGIVHEMTGNPSAAVELYEKVVALNPETTIPEIIHNGTLGLSLTTLAQKRLEALK
jgi:tetratricopeptide (TPR) repeat protein